MVAVCLMLSVVHAAPVTTERLVNANAEVDNWLTHGRSYDESRFSPLKQINDSNVTELGLAWSYEFPDSRGLQSTPIVADGVMYSTGSWSRVYAHNAATGELLWAYDPKVPREYLVRACCGPMNRGVAVWENKVYVGSLDGYLIAVDRESGAEVWRTLTVDQSKDYTITGAPRVVKGRVLIGNGGAEYGVRGYLSAYDGETGELAWRFYTVPGNPADGFENEALEMAAKTWNGEWWKQGGGGTVWDSFSYDPQLNLVYIGVGNGSPWNHKIRSPGGGDNLFLSSIVAVNADTGEYVWHYQTTPGESWDFTAAQQIILADIEWNGEARKVLMQAPKNGFFFVIDRVTGEYLSAVPFTKVLWASGYDENGRPMEAEGIRFEKNKMLMMPSAVGGHNWHSMAYSPDTGLVYIPVIKAMMEYQQPENFD
ncbi:MAG: PQQ-dependent dehydrogenase, methanol/ethanol family, partial [Pseudomonadales bacterium]|nr:PQQ-dependent dehydrogenase, methanol/ethanol family [Pseudomonadales bacterium]